MRKKSILTVLFLFFLFFVSEGYARSGFYLGIQGGYSAQKPSLTDVDFNTNTTFLYGLRAGIKLWMFGLEANYFQAAHNLNPSDILSLAWGEREIDYNYLGLNFKYFLPLLFVDPYITLGYGYYTADVHAIDKDRDGGYNLGVGLELNLGRLSLLAEGKYHRVKLDIADKELKIGDFTLSGGLNIYF
ncbi:MAG: outer membrane beta-barrel protein [Candidatus Aminicenantales bacterium]